MTPYFFCGSATIFAPRSRSRCSRLTFFATVLALTFSPVFASLIRASRVFRWQLDQRIDLVSLVKRRPYRHLDAVEFPARNIARNGRAVLPGLGCGIIDEG